MSLPLLRVLQPDPDLKAAALVQGVRRRFVVLNCLISSYDAAVINLFDDLPGQSDKEVLTELLWRKGVRIERIVSSG